MRLLRNTGPLLGVIAILVIVALVGESTSLATQQDFITALVSAVIVYALYVFVGNSGVISFGHISFVAVGAFAAGELTIPTQPKHFTLPGLIPLLADHSVSNIASLAIAFAAGAIFALVAGIPLMRLSGIAAGIATFAILQITNNLLSFDTNIGPGATTLSLVPTTTGIFQGLMGAILAAILAFGYQRSRRGRLLRATREDPQAAQAMGVNITRERLVAFALSGGIAGLGGGLLVHQLGSITTNQVYLDLTFLTLAMLVVGGSRSLLGATIGAIGISLIDSFLLTAVNTVHIAFFNLTLPGGAADLVLGALMALMLILRPRGVTGGRELSVPRFLRQTRPRPPQ
ncbi:MAG TPA: branched-chain amino acid ABC transporter permease [Solirubrobacteraceae bacterium]|jgi:branched-chain amino acid transport system permease protein|nr:branched-chain amino acid ABC transporter permease [Solirubrobacteraceae bacterium]